MNSLSTSQSWPILTGFLIFNTETQLTNLFTDRKKKELYADKCKNTEKTH